MQGSRHISATFWHFHPHQDTRASHHIHGIFPANHLGQVIQNKRIIPAKMPHFAPNPAIHHGLYGTTDDKPHLADFKTTIKAAVCRMGHVTRSVMNMITKLRESVSRANMAKFVRKAAFSGVVDAEFLAR
jgi:hypothetical protein